MDSLTSTNKHGPADSDDSLLKWWEDSIAETLRLNRSGIESMKIHHYKKATTSFGYAFALHNQIDTELKAKLAGYTAAIFPIESSSEDESSSSSYEPLDFFVRSSLLQENDLVFREAIRLPPHSRDITSMGCSVQQDPSTQYDMVIIIMNFLNACHSYNLALAHHLLGLQVLLTPTRDAKKHLDVSGRFYEYTLRLERVRYKNHQTNKAESGISCWMDPRIVLACLNNLGNVHYHSDQVIQSRQCFRQLQTSTRMLWNTLGRHQTSSLRYLEIQQSYLPIFCLNAGKGLTRLHQLQALRRISAPQDQQQQEALSLPFRKRKSNLSDDYAMKSSAAGAA